MPYVHNKLKVKVQQRSGFDKSFRNSGTIRPGTITPLLCDEVVPKSRVSLKLNLASQLPPLVSDTYMNCKLRVEAFFTPSRLLSKSFEDFFCDFPKQVFDYGDVEAYDTKPAIPYVSIRAVEGSSGLTDNTILGAGSLADYLGIRVRSLNDIRSLSFSLLPFINYHLVWQEWYRNPRVQLPAFVPPIGFRNTDSLLRGHSLPYMYFVHNFADMGSLPGPLVLSGAATAFDSAEQVTLNDGMSLFDLRQRNFGIDYFTGARVDAQQGLKAAVSVDTLDDETDKEGNTGFTIAALRAANSLQQFRERNNLPSPRLVDQVKVRYGANLSDGVAQRPICIGSAVYDIGTRGVDQTAPAGEDQPKNPFSGVAAQYGRAYASGSDFLISDFTANEPGFILVNVTLVPEVTYSGGIAPMFKRYLSEGSITDMACHLLQNVGDQPIMDDEVTGYLGDQSKVFGYQDRFADWMYIPNQSHGRFRSGQNLDSFVLQREFGSNPELSTDFLEIPTNFLDDVFAVSSQVSGVGAWYDALLEYKVSMPLAEWSIPSLQDPAYEHGDTISIHRNGQIF